MCSFFSHLHRSWLPDLEIAVHTEDPGVSGNGGWGHLLDRKLHSISVPAPRRSRVTDLCGGHHLGVLAVSVVAGQGCEPGALERSDREHPYRVGVGTAVLQERVCARQHRSSRTVLAYGQCQTALQVEPTLYEGV